MKLNSIDTGWIMIKVFLVTISFLIGVPSLAMHAKQRSYISTFSNHEYSFIEFVYEGVGPDGCFRKIAKLKDNATSKVVHLYAISKDEKFVEKILPYKEMTNFEFLHVKNARNNKDIIYFRFIAI